MVCWCDVRNAMISHFECSDAHSGGNNACHGSTTTLHTAYVVWTSSISLFYPPISMALVVLLQRCSMACRQQCLPS